MRVSEPVCHLPPNLDDLSEGKSACVQPSAERPAGQVLEREHRRALRLADLINRRNVGMIECRDRSRLFYQTSLASLKVGETRGEKLQRHQPTELPITRLVDDAHR